MPQNFTNDISGKKLYKLLYWLLHPVTAANRLTELSVNGMLAFQTDLSGGKLIYSKGGTVKRVLDEDDVLSGGVTYTDTFSVDLTFSLGVLTADVRLQNTSDINLSTNSGGILANLTTTGITPGTYGSSTQIPVITFDNKGRATVASFVTVSGTYNDEMAQDAVGNILVDTLDIDLTYSDATPSISAVLTTTGVIAGTYGSSTQIPVITVDNKGRITVMGIAPNAGGYTNEEAQDAVGTILLDTADIDFTYNDPAPSISAVLTTTGITPGTYGSTTQIPVITFDNKGRATLASTVAAAASYDNEQAQDAVGTILLDSADIDFTYNDATPSITAVLTTTGITPGIYGDASNFPSITFDNKGRATAAGTFPLTANDTIARKVDMPFVLDPPTTDGVSRILNNTFTLANAIGKSVTFAGVPSGLTTPVTFDITLYNNAASPAIKASGTIVIGTTAVAATATLTGFSVAVGDTLIIKPQTAFSVDRRVIIDLSGVRT